MKISTEVLVILTYLKQKQKQKHVKTFSDKIIRVKLSYNSPLCVRLNPEKVALKKEK